MPDVFRTMILESADAPLGRAIANMFAGSDQHMWQTGLSSDGLPPATHYISTGYVPEGYQVMAPWQIWEQNPETGQWKLVNSYPGRPDIVYGACQQAQPPVECTLQDIEGLFSRADMTPQDPWVAMGRLGLQMVPPSLDDIPAVSRPIPLVQRNAPQPQPQPEPVATPEPAAVQEE